MRALRLGLLLLAMLLVQASFSKAEASPPAAASEDTHANGKQAAPHPDPRVIVDVVGVHGPHKRVDVERSARLAWGRIVRCYNSLAEKQRGEIAIRLVISRSGEVTSARRIRSTLKNHELVQCLTRAMKGLAMPTARAGSTADAEIHVAPGDPP